MMKMSKIFLLTLTVCTLGCGCAKDVAAASETPMPPKMPPSETLSLNEPVSPKGLVERGGQIFITGYNVPVVLDSYGVWRDEDGNEVARKQVREIFKDLPDYGYAVMRFNEDLTELMTDKRTKVLTRFQKYVAPAKEPVDKYFANGIELAWEELMKRERALEFISPKAIGAYELCNEILELSPESVPLYQRGKDWYDQDARKMGQKEVRAWLKKHPSCASKIQAINEANKNLDELPILSDTLGLELYQAFREGYAEKYLDGSRSRDCSAKNYYHWWDLKLGDICDERQVEYVDRYFEEFDVNTMAAPIAPPVCSF